MMDHVSTRCGPHRILFPSRNIESILTLDEGSRVRFLGTRRRGERARADSLPGNTTPPPFPTAADGDIPEETPPAGPTVDLRRLLGVSAAEEKRPRIRLEWVSTDALRRATLLVDAVDEIVTSRLLHLEKVAFLPVSLHPLCDGVLRDPDNTFRISMRLDVEWPGSPFWRRRAWRGALVTVEGGPARPFTPATTEAVTAATTAEGGDVAPVLEPVSGTLPPHGF